MQLLTKERVLLVFVVAGLIFCVFMLLVTTNTITNVSAVEANGVGVYRDSDCTDGVSSIDWGTLGPGSVKNIVVYVRNEVEEPMRLILSTTNWNPPKASEYLNLRWDYTEGRRMDPGEAIQITLILSVSRYIEGISSFSFDILVTGSNRPLGDLNGDGKVGAADIIILGHSLFTKPGDPNWNPDADLNQDGTIGAADLIIIGKHLFESWP